MDLNELQGKVIKVNIARPMKGPIQPLGNRAGRCSVYFSLVERRLELVWDSEEWLREHAKPLAESGGMYFGLGNTWR